VSDDEDTDNGKYNGPERRNKVRRSGKQRRDQSRWNVDSPIRRKGPGRRAHDKLLKKRDHDK
jgi:hypothetical protein